MKPAGQTSAAEPTVTTPNTVLTQSITFAITRLRAHRSEAVLTAHRLCSPTSSMISSGTTTVTTRNTTMIRPRGRVWRLAMLMVCTSKPVRAALATAVTPTQLGTIPRQTSTTVGSGSVPQPRPEVPAVALRPVAVAQLGPQDTRPSWHPVVLAAWR